MGFVADSDIWIDLERGQIHAADIYAITGTDTLYVSPVNVAEIRFGIELMTDAAQRSMAVGALRRLKRRPALRITDRTGEVFGSLAAHLHQSGRGIQFRVQDLWLAALCIERNFTLITKNRKHFEDLPQLRLCVYQRAEGI